MQTTGILLFISLQGSRGSVIKELMLIERRHVVSFPPVKIIESVWIFIFSYGGIEHSIVQGTFIDASGERHGYLA